MLGVDHIANRVSRRVGQADEGKAEKKQNSVFYTVQTWPGEYFSDSELIFSGSVWPLVMHFIPGLFVPGRLDASHAGHTKYSPSVGARQAEQALHTNMADAKKRLLDYIQTLIEQFG